MNTALLHALIVRAAAAPSVHNVQPARWRVEDNAIVLAEDRSRRLSVGDPGGNDAAISLGAAAEALHLAAADQGLALIEDHEMLPDLPEPFRPIVRYHLRPGGVADPLVASLDQRASWRGAFSSPTAADRQATETLAAPDVTPITASDSLARLARQFDRASYGFMQDAPFRHELRSWMRLSRRHPSWSRDGLNAQAMALSPVEAHGANLVLGPAFALFDRVRLAPTLLAEGAKLAGAAGVLLFHRPADEDPFVSGRRFLRLWLQIEGLGMSAAVLAALADDKAMAAQLLADHCVLADHRLVSAFRIGRRTGAGYPRARLPLRDLLI
ncbi:hypothetical protein PMI04_001780 [Sphingobium sp. AP49]|uniref:hypothetical protein n=1 Tax=Sphingobium sp. AP49 TaxID=1144307 RepID=UPI00026ED997|nr:hypothetical protein [Sphingobium sp. AP49]WHO39355.1 hypothetical protein PMI04_001780 [Sphingobium sp. AP49]